MSTTFFVLFDLTALEGTISKLGETNASLLGVRQGNIIFRLDTSAIWLFCICSHHAKNYETNYSRESEKVLCAFSVGSSYFLVSVFVQLFFPDKRRTPLEMKFVSAGFVYSGLTRPIKTKGTTSESE